MLARGAQTPRYSVQQPEMVICSGKVPTSPEAMNAFGLVCVLHAVGERLEFVSARVSAALQSRSLQYARLHPSLDRIQWVLPVTSTTCLPTVPPNCLRRGV